MWALVLIGLLVGATASSHRSNDPYVWQYGKEYHYSLLAKSLVALHQVSNDYSGVVIVGNLTVQRRNDSAIHVKLRNLEYAKVKDHIDGGWSSPLVLEKYHFERLPLNMKSFDLGMNGTYVDNITTSEIVPHWEWNFGKSVASALQIDTMGVKAVDQRPKPGQPFTVFSNMESAVTGKCLTRYASTLMPKYIAQFQPELGYPENWQSDSYITDITKSVNYTHCRKRPLSYFGLGPQGSLETMDNLVGKAISISTTGRAFTSGTDTNYRLQASVVETITMLYPLLYSQQKAMLGSQMKILLQKIVFTGDKPSEIEEPVTRPDLVYEYAEGEVLRTRFSKFGESPNDSGSSSSSDSDESNSKDSDSSNSSGESRNEQSSESDESDDSNSSSSSEDESVRRYRRSVKKLQGLHFFRQSSSSDESSDSSDESISSSEEKKQHQLPQPSMHEPTMLPFSRLFLANRGRPLTTQHAFDLGQRVEEIFQEIGQDLQTPSELTVSRTGEKFLIGRRALQLASEHEMINIANSLAPNKTSTDEEWATWVAFINALAQAGTKPVLGAVGQLIQDGRLNGTLGADTLAFVFRFAITPDKEYLTQGWDLVRSKPVSEDPKMNSTALLAFTDLVYSSAVSNGSSQYPVNVFGRTLSKSDKKIVVQIVEDLKQDLEKAMAKNQTERVHVIIRAIGNTGSVGVAEVFEPYFQGEKYSTSYQRQMMVLALDKLGQINSTLAQNILYNITTSKGELQEVRSLAVFTLIESRPTLSKMQQLAQSLHDEKDKHVISAVSTALLSASKLQSPEYERLAKDANAALDIMGTNMTGIQRSSLYWLNNEIRELNLAYEAKLKIIGSRDTIYPKGLSLSLNKDLGSFKRHAGRFAASATSIRDIFDILSQQIIDEQGSGLRPTPRSGPVDTVADILKYLQIKTDRKEDLEASIFTYFLSKPTLTSFDNRTVSNFAEALKDMAKKGAKGIDIQSLKFGITDQVYFGTCDSLGLPTQISIALPVIASIQGKISVSTKPDITRSPEGKVIKPDSITASLKLTATLSTLAKSEVTVLFPHATSDVHAAGYKEKTLINLPIKAEVNVNLNNPTLSIKIRPIPTEKQRVLHLERVPYISVQPASKLGLSDVQQIHKREPTVWSEKYGLESTGMAFQVDYLSEMVPGVRKSINTILKQDVLKQFFFPLATSEIALQNVSVYYLPQQSTADAVVLEASYESRSEGSNTRELKHKRTHPRKSKRSDFDESDASGLSDDLPQDAANGIKHGRVSSVNVTMNFEGQKGGKYGLAVAVADGPMDPVSRYLAQVWWQNVRDKQPSKVQANVTAIFPPVPQMSLGNANPNATAFVSITNNDGMHIRGKVGITRTLAREQFINDAPLTQLCKGQISQGNYIQSACRNSTLRKYFLNRYDISGNYEKVSPAFTNASYSVYRFFKQQFFETVSVNSVNASGKAGSFEGSVTVAPNKRALNVSLAVSNKINANFTNIRLTAAAAVFLMTHARYSTKDVLLNMATRNQFNATCAVDQSKVNTFDNSTYSVDIGSCWSTVLITARRREFNGSVPISGTPESVAVLVRSIDSKRREVKIVTLHDEILLRLNDKSPVSYKLIVNGQEKEVKKGDLITVNGRDQALLVTSYIDEDSLSVYSMGVQIYFNGQRLLVQPEDYFRDSIRGLCGTFDGQKNTDFKVPRNCIVANGTYFAQEYIFPTRGCKKPTQSYAQCYKENVIVGDNTSGEEQDGESISLRSGFATDAQDDSNMDFRTLFKEFGGKYCFSVRPAKQCNDKSEPKAYQEEPVVFHCVAKSEAAAKWAEKVRHGENLDFLQKKKGHSTHSVKLPTACRRRD